MSRHFTASRIEDVCTRAQGTYANPQDLEHALTRGHLQFYNETALSPASEFQASLLNGLFSGNYAVFLEQARELGFVKQEGKTYLVGKPDTV